MIDEFTLSVRLAGMLLLQDGQISLEEIESLPFVNSRTESRAVAQRLLRGFSSQYNIEVVPGSGPTDVRLKLSEVDTNPESRRPAAAKAVPRP